MLMQGSTGAFVLFFVLLHLSTNLLSHYYLKNVALHARFCRSMKLIHNNLLLRARQVVKISCVRLDRV